MLVLDVGEGIGAEGKAGLGWAGLGWAGLGWAAAQPQLSLLHVPCGALARQLFHGHFPQTWPVRRTQGGLNYMWHGYIYIYVGCMRDILYKTDYVYVRTQSLNPKTRNSVRRIVSIARCMYNM